MTLESQLVAIEKRLWTNDPAFYESALVEDALLVFAETGAISRETAVKAIRVENAEGRRWAEAHFDNVRLVPLTPDAVVLTYGVTARWEHAPATVSALASSVYVHRSGAWKLAFHQQTPL